MKKKIILAGFLFFMVIVAALFLRRPLSAETTPDALSAKLDQLLDGQKSILQEIQAIKDELSGIKNQTNKL